MKKHEFIAYNEGDTVALKGKPNEGREFEILWMDKDRGFALLTPIDGKPINISVGYSKGKDNIYTIRKYTHIDHYF